MRVRSAYCLTVLIVGVSFAFPVSLLWAQQCGDLDNSGAIVTTDALLVLERAVGQPVALMCPPVGLLPGTDPILPATGQTISYNPGSDGDVQAGRSLSYTDNGDGTITDNNTGLMWEKKDDSGGIHDKDNTYSWSTGTNNMDGTIVTTFLKTLNDVAGGGASCFAGHCDWRIPNYRELPSIIDVGVANPSKPSVDPAFHQAATCTGCTDVTLASCSCSGASEYWTSTTLATSPVTAWVVFFSFGGVVNEGKGNDAQVRAVRGGL